MKKLLLSLAAGAGLALGFCGASVYAQDDVKEAIIVEDTSYVPIRMISDEYGAALNWNADTRTVSFKLDETSLSFVAGKTKASVNGDEVKMPASLIYQDRTMVPVRFVSEKMGMDVAWDAINRTVHIKRSGDSELVLNTKVPGQISPLQKLLNLQQNMLLSGMKYIGTPYQFGASNLQTSTFDCSSFTQRVFSEVGIELPRSSRQQYLLGSSINYSDLRVGDLIFYDTAGKGSISHVSIYAGDNQQIHATNSGVVKNDISSYWSQRYMGAKRVF